MPTRREFLAASTAAAALWAAPAVALPDAPPPAAPMVRATDRARVLRQAARWLPEPPDTITSHPAQRSPGTVHDYFSEADYFWPNPANPTGLPYKEIDGRSNPDNFQDHRKAMIRLSLAVPALAAGYSLTGRKDFAHAAAAHLLAWFVTPATRMNPNLELAQGVRNGGPTGRSYGIIDTLHLAEVARAATVIRPTMSPADYAAVQAWFAEYLRWMQTSAKGQKERDATNNHAIAWGVQAAEFARLTQDEPTRAAVRQRWLTVQLPQQMNAQGGFPRELARTKPYGYSIFQFDCGSILTWSLSQPEGSGELTRTALPDGRGMCLAARFLAPFLADKSKWPFPHDVQHWESWPVRSPGLLFCGIACRREDWLSLWRKLDPDPTDPEVIRNFPLRQPVLWV